MQNLEASSMEIIISDSEYRQLVNDKQRVLARNDQLVRQVRMQEEKHQILLNQFTKVKEENQELKMQIKDISKQALRVNRFHLAREDQVKGESVRKQEGIANAQREHRERVERLEEEVLSLRQELDRKEQMILQFQQAEQGQAATQRDKVPQLEEEVLRLKQELDRKGQTIQEVEQAEAGLRQKLASVTKDHLEAIERLKQENTKIAADLISKLERLTQEKEASMSALKKELQSQLQNTQQIKKKLQLKESELQKQKETANTAYKTVEDLLTSEKEKSQKLEQRNRQFKIYIASIQAQKEKAEKRLKESEAERARYRQESEVYISTLDELRKEINIQNVSMSMSEGRSFSKQEQPRDTLHFTEPAKKGHLFQTISSISSSHKKQRAEYLQLQERCKALQREKQSLTLQLQGMKAMELSSQSTSFSQSSSSMMKLDRSFADELKKRDMLLQSQKEEIESKQAKYQKLRAKYANLKKKTQTEVKKITQQKNKIQNEYKKMSESIKSLGKF